MSKKKLSDSKDKAISQDQYVTSIYKDKNEPGVKSLTEIWTKHVNKSIKNDNRI